MCVRLLGKTEHVCMVARRTEHVCEVAMQAHHKTCRSWFTAHLLSALRRSLFFFIEVQLCLQTN